MGGRTRAGGVAAESRYSSRAAHSTTELQWQELTLCEHQFDKQVCQTDLDHTERQKWEEQEQADRLQWEKEKQEDRMCREEAEREEQKCMFELLSKCS